jgi:histidinol-phosphate phosphatase family protein
VNGSGLDAVFLDRDGVVNIEVHRLARPDQLELIEGSGEAVRRINEAGIPVYLVTNQAVVARGMCSEEELGIIHQRLAELLERCGAHLDDVYYCPHHPGGEVEQYRRECPDRKPGTGMLEQAAREHELDLKRCVVIGDRTVDIETAERAGCKSILVSTGYGGSDDLYAAPPTWAAEDLATAVQIVLRESGR